MLKFLIRENKKSAFLGLIFLALFSLDRSILSRLLIFDMDMAKGNIDYNLLLLFLINFTYLFYYFLTNYMSEKHLDAFMTRSRDALNRKFIRKSIFGDYGYWHENRSKLVNSLTQDIRTVTDDYIQGLIQIYGLEKKFLRERLF
ncbi:MAG: hypothetical protein Q4D88_03280 [Anaerococcus sp.]|nr:hypothetical protein [Anaerococcus sp.]